jgi:hypothetical protein
MMNGFLKSIAIKAGLTGAFLTGGIGVLAMMENSCGGKPTEKAAVAASVTGAASNSGAAAKGGRCAAEQQRYDIMFGYNNKLKDQISGCKPGDAMCMYQKQVEFAGQLDECMRGKISTK